RAGRRDVGGCNRGRQLTGADERGGAGSAVPAHARPPAEVRPRHGGREPGPPGWCGTRRQRGQRRPGRGARGEVEYHVDPVVGGGNGRQRGESAAPVLIHAVATTVPVRQRGQRWTGDRRGEIRTRRGIVARSR